MTGNNLSGNLCEAIERGMGNYTLKESFIFILTSFTYRKNSEKVDNSAHGDVGVCDTSVADVDLITGKQQ